MVKCKLARQSDASSLISVISTGVLEEVGTIRDCKRGRRVGTDALKGAGEWLIMLYSAASRDDWCLARGSYDRIGQLTIVAASRVSSAETLSKALVKVTATLPMMG